MNNPLIRTGTTFTKLNLVVNARHLQRAVMRVHKLF